MVCKSLLAHSSVLCQDCTLDSTRFCSSFLSKMLAPDLPGSVWKIFPFSRELSRVLTVLMVPAFTVCCFGFSSQTKIPQSHRHCTNWKSTHQTDTSVFLNLPLYLLQLPLKAEATAVEDCKRKNGARQVSRKVWGQRFAKLLPKQHKTLVGEGVLNADSGHGDHA